VRQATSPRPKCPLRNHGRLMTRRGARAGVHLPAQGSARISFRYNLPDGGYAAKPNGDRNRNRRYYFQTIIVADETASCKTAGANERSNNDGVVPDVEDAPEKRAESAEPGAV